MSEPSPSAKPGGLVAMQWLLGAVAVAAIVQAFKLVVDWDPSYGGELAVVLSAASAAGWLVLELQWPSRLAWGTAVGTLALFAIASLRGMILIARESTGGKTVGAALLAAAFVFSALHVALDDRTVAYLKRQPARQEGS